MDNPGFQGTLRPGTPAGWIRQVAIGLSASLLMVWGTGTLGAGDDHRPICQDYGESNAVINAMHLGTGYHTPVCVDGLIYIPGSEIGVFQPTPEGGLDPLTPIRLAYSAGRTIAVEDGRGYFTSEDYLWCYNIADPGNPEFLGLIPGEFDSRNNGVRQGILYTCVNGQFKAIDATDPQNYQLLYQTSLPDTQTTVAFHDHYLVLVLHGVGIRVYDIQDPQAIHLVSSYHAGDYGYSVEFFGDTMVTYGDNPGLVAYDLQDPGNIVYLGEILEDGSRFSKVGEYLLVPGQEGMTVYSAQQIPQLEYRHVIQQCAGNFKAIDIDGMAYTHDQSGNFVVVDPGRDTDQIDPLHDLEGDGNWSLLRWDNSYLYGYSFSSVQDRGIQIMKPGPNGQVEILGSIDLPYGIQHFEVSDGLLVHGGNPLSLHDVSDPFHPFLLSEFHAGGLMEDFIINGDLLLVGGGNSVRLFSLADPAHPALLLSKEFEEPILYVGKTGRHYVAFMEGLGLLVLEPVFEGNQPDPTGTPIGLEVVGEVRLGDQWGTGDMITQDDHAYCLSEGRLEVVSVVNPEVPKLLQTCVLPSSTNSCQLDFHRGYIYAGVSEAGVAVIDATIPELAHVVGYINTWGRTEAVAATDSYLFGGVQLQHLKTFPLQCSDFEVTCPIDILPQDESNAVPCHAHGQGVLPVAILTTPAFDALTVDQETVRFGPDQAREARPGSVRHEWDVDGDGDMDLLFHFRVDETGIECGDAAATLRGETHEGIPVVGTDLIQTRDVFDGQVEAQINPNPFNPRTTISLALRDRAPVTVRVFDVRGRRIADLLDGVLPAGKHEVTWNGRLDSGGEAPSGRYFFRIRKGSEVEVLQATLVR